MEQYSTFAFPERGITLRGQDLLSRQELLVFSLMLSLPLLKDAPPMHFARLSATARMKTGDSQRSGEHQTYRFLVRDTTPADAHAVSELLRRAFLDFEERYAPQAFLATVPPEDGVLARLSEGPIWVAERQSTLIGTVSVVQMQDSVMVRGMAVDPGARGPWNRQNTARPN